MRPQKRLVFALTVVLFACAATPFAPKGVNADAPPAVLRYRVDAERSKFTVRAFAGGPLWFRGHDHLVAVRDFSGEATLTPTSVKPASLTLRVRADSLVETRDVFTEQQKEIINKELREVVLETDKYPEITYRSSDVTGKLVGGVYRVEIRGDLTLHGVTHRLLIPAEVTAEGEELRARGEFELKRSEYGIKATSAFHGTVRIRDKLKFTFDIVARKV